MKKDLCKKMGHARLTILGLTFGSLFFANLTAHANPTHPHVPHHVTSPPAPIHSVPHHVLHPPHSNTNFNPAPVVPQIPVRQNTFTAGKKTKKFYFLNLDGLDQYLTDIRPYSPELYNTLHPQIEDLRWKNTMGWVLSGTLWAASIGLTVGGLIHLSQEWDKEIGEFGNFDDGQNYKANTTPGIVMLSLGGAALVGGFLPIFLMGYDQEDILDLVNQHYEIAPDSELQIHWGFNVIPTQHYGLSTTLRF